MRGVFGYPDVRIVRLDRRSKKGVRLLRSCAEGGGMTVGRGKSGTCRAALFGSCSSWRFGGFCAARAGR